LYGPPEANKNLLYQAECFRESHTRSFEMNHKISLKMKHLFPFSYVKPVFLLLAFLLISSGCSGAKNDARGERIPVSGLVYYDGDPLTSARILFISDTPEGKVKSSAKVFIKFPNKEVRSSAKPVSKSIPPFQKWKS
jgi:hypothetical protein